MDRSENERLERDEREIDLFMQESRRAIGGVKARLKHERQVRRVTAQWAAIGLFALVIGVSFFPEPMYAALSAVREWVAAHVPFRTGPHQYIYAIRFSTGGMAYSPEPTRRWLDDLRVFEYSDGEWVERFSDDFEQNALDSLPSGWEAERQCPPDTGLFIDAAGPDSQGVDLGRSVALTDRLPGNCASLLSRPIGRYSGAIALEWSERHESLDDALIAECGGSQGPHGPFSVGMYGNDPNNPGHHGWIVLGTVDPETGEERSPRVFEWEPDTWYRLRVEIDIPSQTFDFIVDSVSVWSE
jgi:hypothetical protein